MMATEYTPAELKFMERFTHHMDSPVPPLSTEPPTKHPLAGRTPGVRSTSRQAYKSIQTELSTKQREVYVAIQMSKRPVNDRELVGHLGVSISSLTARRNELVEMGKVEEAFRQVDPKTNRRTIYWQSVTGEAQS